MQNPSRRGKTAAQLLEARLAQYAAQPRRSANAHTPGVVTDSDGRQWLSPNRDQILQALGGVRPRSMGATNLALNAWARGRGYAGGATNIDTLIHLGLAKASAGAKRRTRAGTGWTTVRGFSWLV